ncbi:MAG: Pilus assembly protein PilW [Massilia sp.]|jgi:type IV pilus assembly protein PilW|nr:Pilus assembly protein PilW [Massilia sp.]
MMGRMTHRINHRRGATIVELMVALTVGMLVLLMAAGMLVSANAAYAAQVEAAALDDAGRFALEIITRAARQGGFVNWEREEAGADPGAAPAHVTGLDARTLARATEGIDGPLGDAVNGSDVLALRFAGAGLGANGDGSVVDCAGFGVGRHEEGWSIFYVARNATGEAELRCKYRGNSNWSADAIVAGIDSFQVLYGLDTDSPPDGVANEYVSAGVLDERDAALVLAAFEPAARERERLRRTHWKRVTSIRVALVIHGQRRGLSGFDPIVFELFGRAYSDAAAGFDPGVRLDEAQMPDEVRGRARRMFASTVLLRNPSGQAQ